MKPFLTPRFSTAVRFQAQGGVSCLNCGAPFVSGHVCPIAPPTPASPGMAYLQRRGILQTSAIEPKKERP